MIVTHKISVDLAARGNMPRVDVVQDDKYSRNLEISLFSDGAVWKIPEGALPVIRYKKPDGTGGNYDVLPDGTEACTVSNNMITVALAPQVCTAPGLVQLAVGLVKDRAEINTFTISIGVQENPGVEAASEDYYRVVGLLPSAGWEPNMCLGTNENGEVATISDLTNVEYLTIVNHNNTEHGFCMFAGETAMNEDASPAYAVAEFFGYYGDEQVVLRGIADGVRNQDAVTVRQLQAAVPESLPNPNPLTINGTAYDGSAPVELTIEGGGSGGGMATLFHVVTEENTQSIQFAVENPRQYSMFLISGYVKPCEALASAYTAVIDIFGKERMRQDIIPPVTLPHTDSGKFALLFGMSNIGDEYVMVGSKFFVKSAWQSLGDGGIVLPASNNVINLKTWGDAYFPAGTIFTIKAL